MEAAAKKESLDVFTAEIKPSSKEVEETKSWIIYPDSVMRSLWDIVMTV